MKRARKIERRNSRETKEKEREREKEVRASTFGAAFVCKHFSRRGGKRATGYDDDENDNNDDDDDDDEDEDGSGVDRVDCRRKNGENRRKKGGASRKRGEVVSIHPSVRSPPPPQAFASSYRTAAGNRARTNMSDEEKRERLPRIR